MARREVERMKRRYFSEGWKDSWKESRRPRRPVRIIPVLLMLIGLATVIVAVARYLIVPLLVWLGGNS